MLECYRSSTCAHTARPVQQPASEGQDAVHEGDRKVQELGLPLRLLVWGFYQTTNVQPNRGAKVMKMLFCLAAAGLSAHN